MDENIDESAEESVFDGVPPFEDKFLQTFIDKMQSEEDMCNKVHGAVISGGNKVAYNTVQEIVAVEDDWISVLENCIFNIENIVRNPRKFIEEEENIVEVSRAKRTIPKRCATFPQTRNTFKVSIKRAT